MSNERSEMTNGLTKGVQCINSIIYLLSRVRVSKMRCFERVVRAFVKAEAAGSSPQPLAAAGGQPLGGKPKRLFSQAAWLQGVTHRMRLVGQRKFPSWSIF